MAKYAEARPPSGYYEPKPPRTYEERLQSAARRLTELEADLTFLMKVMMWSSIFLAVFSASMFLKLWAMP